MKKLLIIMVLGALTAYLIPADAQTQEWQSTSAMQDAGSRYSSQVTPVGATGVGAMSSTTSSFAPVQAPNGPRRTVGGNSEPGTTNDPGSPLGDALLPLLLCAAAFSGIVYLRRRRIVRR